MNAFINELKEEWTKFLDVSYDGIIIVDGSGTVVYMNDASERLEEVSKEYIIGKNVKELEKLGIYEKSVSVLVLKSKTRESIMQYKGGKQLVITGIPIFEGNQIKWIYINERDVTELKAVKKNNEIVMKEAERYKQELESLKKENLEHNVITKSSEMDKITKLLDRVAKSNISVLLEGESGVGKDVFAKWIHKKSDRSDKKFVKLDCSSFPETLLESELFGYVKGAFTGANKQGKVGLVETANGGTLFLDEIGEMPLSSQVKLLRLLQDQEFIPLGDSSPKIVDIRVIAATNRDLLTMVDEGLFRKDLYYRLNVVPVFIPALRDRRADIDYFVHFFLNKYNRKHGFNKEITPAALKTLCRYDWPGNVRELSNVMERLVVITPKSIIENSDVIEVIGDKEITNLDLSEYKIDECTYSESLHKFEKQYFKELLNSNETLVQLSNRLEISESTLKRKLKKLGLSKKGHY